jgi:hypothetical protein
MELEPGVPMIRVVTALAFSTLACSAVNAAECTYVNELGDEITQDGINLVIDWSSDDSGRPTDGKEICPTMGTGTGIMQRTAVCPITGQQLYSFASSKPGSDAPDSLAFYGLVWFRHCS